LFVAASTLLLSAIASAQAIPGIRAQQLKADVERLSGRIQLERRGAPWLHSWAASLKGEWRFITD
jgi:hypothetical protein